MQPPHQTSRSGRLRRRNAIQRSTYVPSPEQPRLPDSPQQLDSEEGDLGVIEAGEAEEGGDEAVLVEGSTSSAAVAAVREILVKRRINNWRKLELIGTGSFGRVYEAVSEDGFVFVVKEASLIGPESFAKQSASHLEQEILLLSQLEHENIVQYFGAIKEETALCIFLEFVSEGSLVSIYEKHELEEPRVSVYTRQILNGLTYLHHHNVLHRDIKRANILVDGCGTVKLADFGLAKEIKIWKMKRSCTGSVYWMAPEVVRNNPYGQSADIWSLGCTVLEMLTHKLPYPDENWVSVFYQIGCGQLPPIPSSLSQVARDFIFKCLRVNPDDRPSADELLKDPFVAISEPD